MLLGAPPTLAPAKIAQLIKGGSSAWIHDTFPDLRAFAWQDGYGAFTVSKSGVPDVTVYIENQREHHRTRTYQEEYRALLDRQPGLERPGYRQSSLRDGTLSSCSASILAIARLSPACTSPTCV